MRAEPFDAINLRPGPIPHCQICRSKDLELVLDLGHTAPVDSPLSRDQLRQPETVFPLRLVRCPACGLVQIDYCVDPRLLFHADYPYLSGITWTLRRHLDATATTAMAKLGLPPGGLVVDIGSNDGTLLEGFRRIGMRVLGVEATNIAQVANHKGITTLQGFFNLKMVEQIIDIGRRACLVTATNVFAHVNHLGTLLRGIHRLLEDDGYFISESHYLLDILGSLQYDSIYHEHLRYYSLRPLIQLFDRHGFTLVDAERIPNYGGSIRVYARKGRGHAVAPAVSALLAAEDAAGVYAAETYRYFAARVEESRRGIRSLLVRLRDEEKSVAGIGCPGRAATLLAYCGITPDLLPYIAEQATCLKVGMFTPGTHIPVVDEAQMLSDQPDYGLLLSWHYADDIVRNLRRRGLRSEIIVPLATVRMVGPEAQAAPVMTP